MKRTIQISLSGVMALFFLASVTFAQEATEVTVQVKKDGKVVKDTTYRFEDDTDAKNAVKMFDMLSGEKTEIKEMTGDSLVWISEGEGGEGPVKIMKYRVEKGDDSGEDHVVVVTSGEGGSFDILLDEELEGEPGAEKKRVKVIISEDEDGVTHISNEEIIEREEEVYVISGDETEKELKEIMEKMKNEDEGEDVKVIVIRKKDKSKQ